MRTPYLLLFLLAFLSFCSKKEKVLAPVLPISFSEGMLIEAGDSTTTDFSQLQIVTNEKGDEQIIGYSTAGHAFEIIDLTTGKFAKIIKIQSEGPDFIPHPVRRFHYYKDTFLIASQGYLIKAVPSDSNLKMVQRISLVNGKLNSLKNIDFTTSKLISYPGNNFHDRPVHALSFNDISGNLLLNKYANQSRNAESFFKTNIAGMINFKDSAFIDLPISYPEPLLSDGKDFPYLFNPFLLYQGDSIIYNFPMSSKIYLYKIPSNSISMKDVPSVYIPDPKPLADYKGDFKELKRGIDYYANSSQFFEIRWDPYREFFYRIGKKETVGGKLSLTGPRRFGNHFIQIMNREFNLIDEVMIPKNFDSFFLVSKKGLIFPLKDRKDENLLEFGMMTF